MNYPLVSVVTPSFNQKDYIEDTLISIQKQDYASIEHIVIDGLSTDGSQDIIWRHESSLSSWVSERDNGQSEAINKGFACASGSIFAWLNSDDLLAPSAVSIAVRFLMDQPEVGLVYGDRVEIDAKGNIVGFLRLSRHDERMFQRGLTLPQETVFFRRELFEKVGDLDEELHFAMDTDLWCKMALVTRMKHIPAFLGYFRRHEGAKSVMYHMKDSGVNERYHEERVTVQRRHFGCGLPSPSAVKWYRLLHRIRLIRDIASKQRAEDLRLIRETVDHGFPAASETTEVGAGA